MLLKRHSVIFFLYEIIKEKKAVEERCIKSVFNKHEFYFYLILALDLRSKKDVIYP